MDENVYIVKIKPEYKDKINPYYLRYIRASNYFKTQVSNNLANAKLKKINKGVFEKLIIPILPIDIQNKIGEEFIALEKNYINLREQLIKELYVKKKEYQSAINESIKLIPDNK